MSLICTTFLRRIASNEPDYGVSVRRKRQIFTELVLKADPAKVYGAFMNTPEKQELMKDILGYQAYIDLMNVKRLSAKKVKVSPKCKLTKRCPAGYRKAEIESIAKMCGLSTSGKTSKDLCIEIKLKLREASGDTGKILYDVDVDGIMLAKDYIGKKTKLPVIKSVKGWFVSEKFDGARAIWNGQNFVSRSGTVFEAPEWYKNIMPKVALDGELYLGHDMFEKTMSAIRKKVPIDKEWAKIKYEVFDAPSLVGPPKERIRYYYKVVKDACAKFKPIKLKGITVEHCPLVAVKQTPLKDEAELQELYKEVLKAHGEGLMLRKPGSKYVGSRSSSLLKYKPEFDDEGIIIGYEMGSGRNKGKLGAFIVQSVKNPNQTFKVGTGLSDKIRETYRKSHPLGTMITYAYSGLTKNDIPRQPKYVRIREVV